LTTTDQAQSTDVNGEYLKNGQESLISKTSKKTKKRSFQLLRSEKGSDLSPKVHSFDLWLSMKNMKRISHQTLQYGNCLYESIANCIHCGKENQLN
jgi:hypothetical protein